MIKTILFDFDGTIADTIPTITHILHSLSKKYRYKDLTDEEMKKMRDKTIQEVFKELHVPLYKLPLIAADVKKELNKHIVGLQCIKGMKEVLHALHDKGYNLAIITSNNKDIVQAFLKNNDLDIFDFIYTGTTIFGKARVIRNVLNTYSLATKEVLYVGDEIRDIEATKKVGIPIIVCSWGANSKERLAKLSPEFLVDSPEEILPILENTLP